ncbi:hypothetical protein [uncultured Microbacterium sp.]|uniref:Uncharacterized protein n=1 Tax=uncultured Microbacterium sp. TaxID=191216 RepID=A0A1Y5P2R4_9MICO|nr:hypothetical protein [uncultured Microbacterium sp.]SBS72994.1 hypothetical protein MIPYR_30342 [uncultured Microbacterium sp.]
MTETASERQHALRGAAIHYVRERSVKSRVRRVAVPLVLCGVLAGGGVTYAAATVLDLATDYPSPQERAITDQLEPLVQKLQAVAGGEGALVTTIDDQPNGFGSLIVETDRPALTLYWKGAVPVSISRIIDEHPDIDVTIRDAPFNYAELAAARDAIAAQLNEELDGRGTLVRVGPESQARGLIIDVQTERALTEDDIRRAVARLTTVPLVEISVGEEGVTLF